MNRSMRRGGAFTLVEVLVVMTVILILVALLMPALGGFRELARRVQCASNMHQLHMVTLAYAGDHRGYILAPRFDGGQHVPIAMNPPEILTWAKYGIFHDVDDSKLTEITPEVHGKLMKIWNCPSRDWNPQWETHYNQVVIGYQYLGGIPEWNNPEAMGGRYESRSPLNAQRRSDPRWALVADAIGKIDGVWGGGRASAYGGMPTHRSGPDPQRPEGGNHVYMAGNVEFVPFERMWYVHNWASASRRKYFFYQEDLGEHPRTPFTSAALED